MVRLVTTATSMTSFRKKGTECLLFRLLRTLQNSTLFLVHLKYIAAFLSR